MRRYRIIGISRNVRSSVCTRILSDAKLDQRPATSMSSANIIPYASELGVDGRCHLRWPVASREAALLVLDRRFRLPLRTYFCLCISKAAEAADLVQDVFEKGAHMPGDSADRSGMPRMSA
jgi:hypothetical protein